MFPTKKRLGLKIFRGGWSWLETARSLPENANSIKSSEEAEGEGITTANLAMQTTNIQPRHLILIIAQNKVKGFAFMQKESTLHAGGYNTTIFFQHTDE